MSHGWRRTLGLGWSACMAVLLVHQICLWQRAPWDTDIFALLPQGEQEAGNRALKALSEATAQEVLVAVGANDWPSAQRASQAFNAQLTQQAAPLQASPAAPDFAALLQFYRPYRAGLLTPTQRSRLRDAPVQDLSDQALAALYAPAGGPHLTPWIEDPLGLWPGWWAARAQDTPAQPRDGLLAVQRDGREYALLLLQSTRPGFSLGQAGQLTAALESAQQAAQATGPGVSVWSAGFPVHADAAAMRAHWEINTIGWGSLAAVLLFVWLAFRSLRPLALVVLSLTVGCAAGLSVTAAVFGHVHVLTLVFGSTLVGVAEDYGIHYFANRQGRPPSARWHVLREHLPGLSMAMATSVLGYVAMGLAPFPGLRQMALFSATGIAAAFATVVCWFPWLDGGALPETPLCRAIAASLRQWPRFNKRSSAWAGAALVIVAGAGLARLHANDDLRSLQSSPPELVAQQRQVGDLLGLPSPAQFFEVHGHDAETVLQREEALCAALAPLLANQTLAGVRATSRWLPSQQQQRADAVLSRRIEAAVLARVAQATGQALVQPPPAAPLTLEAWQGKGSAAVRGLWLGATQPGGELVSVVQVRGLQNSDSLLQLAAVAEQVPGVRWVNKTADISALLRRYRSLMLGLLAASALAVGALLWLRFGRHAWRAWVPTVLATFLAMAMLGVVGLPLQLFAVLALLLVVGIGVDYGIFLLEDPGQGTAWVAVVMGAASTWLSFGLLGLSQTPALRVFGLTTFFGVGWVWFLTPYFRRESASIPGEES